MVSRHYPSPYGQYKSTRNNILHKLNIGSLTTDMISPPLSPDSDFDSNHITPQVRQALEYLSNKLQKNSSYLTFVAMRSRPLPIGQGCNLTAIPVGQLSTEVILTLQKHIRRAAKKFDLGSNWMVLSDSIPHREYVINKTIRQNDVLFSLEGLTLLNVDRIYLLKQYLSVLSSATPSSSPSSSTPIVDHIPNHIYVDSCLLILRKLMQDTAGRPFTKNFFHCAYDHLSIHDSLLANIAKEYFSKYGHNAILLSKPNVAATKPDSSTREAKYRLSRSRRSKDRASPSGKRVGFTRKPSPASPCPRIKTPHSASDVTPITRNEWHLLMGEPLNLTRHRPVQTT